MTREFAPVEPLRRKEGEREEEEEEEEERGGGGGMSEALSRGGCLFRDLLFPTN